MTSRMQLPCGTTAEVQPVWLRPGAGLPEVPKRYASGWEGIDGEPERPSGWHHKVRRNSTTHDVIYAETKP